MSDDGRQGLGALTDDRLYDHERELQLKRDAASELYEACSEALAFVEEMEGKFDKHFLVGGKLFEALRKARAASPTPNPHHPPEGE